MCVSFVFAAKHVPVPRVNQATAGCCHSRGSEREKKQKIWMAEDLSRSEGMGGTW